MEEKKLTDEEIVKALERCAKYHFECNEDCNLYGVEECTVKLCNGALDLIRRLQYGYSSASKASEEWKAKYKAERKENAEYERKLADGDLVSIEWHDEQVGHAEEEIERLTEENGILKGNPPMIAGRNLGKTIRAKLLVFDRIKEQNAELQKQVDELKAENLSAVCDLNMRIVELDNELKQAKTLLEFREETIKYLEDANIRYAEALENKVKDTAKEIFDWLKSEVIMTEIPHGGEPSEEDVEAVMWWQIEEHFKKRYGVEVE